jgi:hypothetical protein
MFNCQYLKLSWYIAWAERQAPQNIFEECSRLVVFTLAADVAGPKITCGQLLVDALQ